MELGKTITKIIVLLLVFTQVNFGFSQKKEEDVKMPSKYKPGIFWHFTGLHAPKDTFIHKYDRIHASVIYCDYIGDRNGVKSKWYSIGFNVGALWDQPFGKSPVGIAIGLSFTHFQWHNNGEFTFPTDSATGDQYTALNPYSGSEVRKRHKFASNYLEVPFEFRIRTKGNVKFKFYPGFKFGVRLNSFAKWVHDDGSKYKEFNFPDINRIRYGPTLRIGVDWFQLWAAYYFNKTFKNPNSPNLQQFEAGITISIL
jgi:hypothetical protein